MTQTQLDLLDVRSDGYGGMTARARNTDPQTSHDAAAKVERTGKAGSDRRRCFEIVTAFPGLTYCEIAKKLGVINPNVVSRRLPELRPEFVFNGETRKCSVTGNDSMTWYPVKGSNR